MKRLALLVSKMDHCLYDLLIRHRGGELRCEIPVIISNHPDLAPVAQVRAAPRGATQRCDAMRVAAFCGEVQLRALRA